MRRAEAKQSEVNYLGHNFLFQCSFKFNRRCNQRDLRKLILTEFRVTGKSGAENSV